MRDECHTVLTVRNSMYLYFCEARKPPFFSPLFFDRMARFKPIPSRRCQQLRSKLKEALARHRFRAPSARDTKSAFDILSRISLPDDSAPDRPEPVIPQLPYEILVQIASYCNAATLKALAQASPTARNAAQENLWAVVDCKFACCVSFIYMVSSSRLMAQCFDSMVPAKRDIGINLSRRHIIRAYFKHHTLAAHKLLNFLRNPRLASYIREAHLHVCHRCQWRPLAWKECWQPWFASTVQVRDGDRSCAALGRQLMGLLAKPSVHLSIHALHVANLATYMTSGLAARTYSLEFDELYECQKQDSFKQRDISLARQTIAHGLPIQTLTVGNLYCSLPIGNELYHLNRLTIKAGRCKATNGLSEALENMHRLRFFQFSAARCVIHSEVQWPAEEFIASLWSQRHCLEEISLDGHLSLPPPDFCTFRDFSVLKKVRIPIEYLAQYPTLDQPRRTYFPRFDQTLPQASHHSALVGRPGKSRQEKG